MATTLHPGVIPSATSEINALLTGAAIAPLDQTGWIRVTGEDRVRWLNGMVTNSIQDLAPGQGCYNFVLNAQGRIQGDLTAFALEDSILLEIARDQIESLTAYLDRFIIMDDVELADISDQRRGLLFAGPKAAAHLLENRVPAISPMHRETVRWRSAWVDVHHAYSPLVPRYELWSDPETIAALSNTLAAVGTTMISAEALEHLRILSGTPRYGTDIRNSETARDLPQETAQTRALHFSKGCYLGQEIVERIHSRGAVHRTFTGFELTGTLPPTGTALTAEGKSVGELTSVASIQLPNRDTPIQLALGYIRREALDRGLPLQYPGGSAVPVRLPYSNL
jgi:folate-binding protein YgfZ